METQTKTVPIEKHVYKQLAQKAKLEGITTDEYVERLVRRRVEKLQKLYPEKKA